MASQAQFAPRLGRRITLGHVRAALELAHFALERAHLLHHLPELDDQALALPRIQFDRTRQLRYLDARPGDCVPSTQIRTLLRFRDTRESRALFECDVVESGDMVENLQSLPRLLRDCLFLQLLVIKVHDLLDRASTLAQIFGNRQQLFNDDGRACDGLQDEELAPFDALGKDDFTFAREQGNSAHLPQVYADRVGCLFEEARRQVEGALLLYFRLQGLGSLQRGLRGGNIFVDLDAVGF